MSEPQVWTLIGVFSAGLFGMLTIMSTLFVRVLRAEIGTVRAEVRGIRTEISAEIIAINGRIDRNITALMRHTFGIGQG